MKSNRLKILAASLCLIVSGAITLYNIGVFDAKLRTQTGERPNAEEEGAEAERAGSLPDEDF
jgi:hypothetical protein